MKRYNIDRIVKETKRIRKEEKEIQRIINNLLPSSIEQLREVIQVNTYNQEDFNY